MAEEKSESLWVVRGVWEEGEVVYQLEEPILRLKHIRVFPGGQQVTLWWLDPLIEMKLATSPNKKVKKQIDYKLKMN
jgi:hypothetical protein